MNGGYSQGGRGANAPSSLPQMKSWSMYRTSFKNYIQALPGCVHILSTPVYISYK